MFIYVIHENAGALPNSRLHTLEHIFQHNGWFKTEDKRNANIDIEFSDRTTGIKLDASDNHFKFLLPEKEFKNISGWLACQDSHSPDIDPPAISAPVMDQILCEWHKKLINGCLKYQHPFIYKLPWPEGKQIALIISHDIDLTRKYGVKSLVKDTFSLRLARLIEHYNMSVFGKNIYWNFQDLLRFYREQKLQSSFFFIAKKWEKTQYRYNIKQSKFRRLVQNILSHNHEIGLHSSRYSFDSPALITREKQKLEKIMGQPVQGVRQHYLRVLFPGAWRNFEQAGFRYDSSCGYNNAIGFRAGTSVPFRSFNYEQNKDIDLYEIPFSIMDYSWEELSRDQLQQQNLFDKLVQQIVDTSGLVHVLWHPHNLAESAFIPYWNQLVNWMDKKQFFNTTLHGLLEWRRKRTEIDALSFRESSKGLEFVLQTPESIEDLALGIVSAQPLVQNDRLKLIAGQNHYRLQIPRLLAGEHQFRLPYES
jgi:hypothetical protein